MKTIHLKTRIPAELTNLRLDQALAKLFPDYSRAVLQNWIKSGFVLLNGQVATRPRHKIELNQEIEITATIKEAGEWQGQDIPISIIFEDESILVINKPAGLVVHPGAGVPDKTLINALLHHTPELKHLPRAGLIHRLDKNTSGLLIIAKTLPAHHALSKALQAREIHREYEAIVCGVMISGGEIDAAIGRHPQHRTRMSVVAHGGRQARTHYRVLERFRAHTRLRVQLETGRTHQIRVHLAHINYPIVGDSTYNKRKSIPAHISTPLKNALLQFKRQALHARYLSFNHPKTGEPVKFEAPLPEDMLQLIQLLREDVTNAKTE